MTTQLVVSANGEDLTGLPITEETINDLLQHTHEARQYAYFMARARARIDGTTLRQYGYRITWETDDEESRTATNHSSK